MFRPQAQAETHSGPGGAPRTSSPTHAETHSEPVGAHAPHHRKAVAILQHLFFLFMYRLQAQSHSGPGSMLRDSRKDLFFLFIYRLQAQARPRHSDSEAGPGEA